jgi:carotenoid cleavage dioxygenase-like enzyme
MAIDERHETSFRPGFVSLTGETVLDELPVRGALPDWLAGTLVRNGPALFEANGRSLRHWFDGQAMLHRFTFGPGRVSYANRFLDTPGYRALRHRGRLDYREFATDPCVSLFGRFFTRFRARPEPTANANVNVVTMGDRDLAVTETPLAVEFDPETLATVGVVDYDDDLGGQLGTAHPHADPRTGDPVNYALRFSRHSEYRFYRQRGGALRRELIGSVRADLPGYVHSFAITERYAVLAIFPFVVSPLSLVLRHRPFIENYRWRPELGTRIAVLDLADGTVRREYVAPPLFAFHHVNAYEDGTDLVLDLCAYDDATVVEALYLDRLRAGGGAPMALPTRLRLDLAGGGVDVRLLSPMPLELPRINYGAHNGRPYRTVYGTSAGDRAGPDFFDRLGKLDTTTGQTWTWREDGCYPGEPVFVPAPGARDEEDGVLLSVVLDARSGRSFLLVLDAPSLTELARAEVPHVIPFGFHGRFSS